MRALADDGRAIVFVTHKLDEVIAVSDRVTVLRDGRKVGAMATAEADPATLARMMVGRDLSVPERSRTAPGEPVLPIRGVTAEGQFILGAVASSGVGLWVGDQVGGPVGIVLMLVAGALAGAL